MFSLTKCNSGNHTPSLGRLMTWLPENYLGNQTKSLICRSVLTVCYLTAPLLIGVDCSLVIVVCSQRGTFFLFVHILGT